MEMNMKVNGKMMNRSIKLRHHLMEKILVEVEQKREEKVENIEKAEKVADIEEAEDTENKLLYHLQLKYFK
jgi:hypothetical protein